MIDPAQFILAQSDFKSSLFPITSRYSGVELTTLVAPDGRTIVYLRRRFIPPPGRFAPRQEHTVTQDERLDNITARYLGDPEQFWRICDSNAAMRPDELTDVIGRRLRITLPEGIPEASRA